MSTDDNAPAQPLIPGAATPRFDEHGKFISAEDRVKAGETVQGPSTPVQRQIIKISPELLEWIQRVPSRRVAVHRDRWKAAPAAPPEADDV